MSTEEKSLNFLEQIIEEDLKNGLSNDKLRFRFPPEPNGYLHVGHASAICLNFGLGIDYQSPVNLRFDDTNPAKEEQEYVDAIKKDIEWLGYQWANECYASDYFQQLYDWAVEFIKKGKAYVDSQSSEEMAKQKGTPTQVGTDSPYRNRSVEENLDLFERMKNGEFEEGTHILRAKIDMSHNNMLMRDPIMYRILKKHHHRTGNDWCIYPMYDWAHGESDYLEQISHSFCTLEFLPHRELYDWFLDQVYDDKKVRPKQREFARRNLSHTVVSKRKLLQLVEEKHVNGWDDPRMSTISGMRRRGYPPMAIRNFAKTIGIAKRTNLIDVSLLEFCVREELNKTAPRVMAVLNPVKLVITNYPDGQEEWLEAENNPEEEVMTYRKVPFSKELYIEREDADSFINSQNSIQSEIRLKNAYIVKIDLNNITHKTDGYGELKELYVTYDRNTRSGSGSEASKRKVSKTIQWISIPHAIKAEIRLYDRLFTDESPDTHQDKNFLEFVNKDSLKIVNGYVESSLINAKVEDKFQFTRIGYFCLDKDTSENNLVFNKTVDLKVFVKDNSQDYEKKINFISRTYLNKFFKIDSYDERKKIREEIKNEIIKINDSTFLKNTFIKKIDNDKASLLLANLIYRYYENLDIDDNTLFKFYKMSINSSNEFVRTQAYKNFIKHSDFDIAIDLKETLLVLEVKLKEKSNSKEIYYLDKVLDKINK